MKNNYYPQQQFPQPINHENGIVEQYIPLTDAFTTNIDFLKHLTPAFANQVNINNKGTSNNGVTGIRVPLDDNIITKQAFSKAGYNRPNSDKFRNDVITQMKLDKNKEYKTTFGHTEREGYIDAVDQLINDYYSNRDITKPSKLGRIGAPNSFEYGLDARYQLDRDPSVYQQLMNQNKHVLNSWSELQACQNNSELGSGCSNWIKKAYPKDSQIGYIVKDSNNLKNDRNSFLNAQSPQNQQPQQQQNYNQLSSNQIQKFNNQGQLFSQNQFQQQDQSQQQFLQQQKPIQQNQKQQPLQQKLTDSQELQEAINRGDFDSSNSLARGGRVTKSKQNPLIQMMTESRSDNPLINYLLGFR